MMTTGFGCKLGKTQHTNGTVLQRFGVLSDARSGQCTSQAQKHDDVSHDTTETSVDVHLRRKASKVSQHTPTPQAAVTIMAKPTGLKLKNARLSNVS